jgi:hypothetical protein
MKEQGDPHEADDGAEPELLPSPSGAALVGSSDGRDCRTRRAGSASFWAVTQECRVFTIRAPARIAFWGNVAFHLEGRSSSGFQWRAYLGYATVLNTKESTCTFHSADGQRKCGDFRGLVSFGTMLGYAF